MTKRALSAVAGFLGLCVPLCAQDRSRAAGVYADPFNLNRLGQSGSLETASTLRQSNIFHALDSAFLRAPSLTLADDSLFSLANAFGWIETTAPDLLPPSTAPNPQRVKTSAMRGTEPPSKPLDLSAPLDYAHGEIGVMYGRSTGKFGGDYKSGYIISEMGNDKFHLTVGTFYEESSGRGPRFGR